MKYIGFSLFVAILVFVFFLFKPNKSSTGFKRNPPDTIRTAVLYYFPPQKGYRLEVVYRISKDSFDYFDLDSTTKKKTWSRVKTYYVPVLDTLRNEFGKPIIDSATKKVKFFTFYPELGAKFVKSDMNINMDSLLRAEAK